MELSEKLTQIYAAGHTRADVARLTHCTDDVVAMWEGGPVNVSDEKACSLLLRLTVVEFAAFLEQQRALDQLIGKGFSQTRIARLIGVEANSVRAWDRAMKLACGRRRELLLSYASMTADQVESLATGGTVMRGRLSPDETKRRIAAMKEVGLWPYEERARKLKTILENGRQISITAAELINLLGIGRRAFYDYLSPESKRLMPVEAVKRYESLSASLDSADKKDKALAFLITPEERFTQASIVLFEQYHYTGFTAGDPVKERALKVLAHITGYHERTLRRYMPLRADPQRRVPRVVIEALEFAAHHVGSLVRLSS